MKSKVYYATGALMTPHRARYANACRSVRERWESIGGDRHNRYRLQEAYRVLCHVTRLWNYADGPGEPDSEALWAILQAECPFAFEDPRDANSLLFCYADSVKGGAA